MPDFNRSKKLITEEHRLVPRSRRYRLRIARTRSIPASDRRAISTNLRLLSANNLSSMNVNGEVQITGFARGLDVERILGITRNADGSLMFAISWKDEVVADFVPASEVYEHVPQLAIAYFEERLVFENDVRRPLVSDPESDTEGLLSTDESSDDDNYY